MVTPDYITRLEPNEIFVFGSNLAAWSPFTAMILIPLVKNPVWWIFCKYRR